MDKIILDGRYEIIKEIGVGGMAKVYKAKDKLLGRFVAIKILKEQYAEDEEFSKKFNNEAQSAARLSHINIVNVYDIGKDMLNGKLIQYIVMEYVEGETLKDLINREKVLENHDIIDYSTQIAQALKSAHDSGIVHRDIKPQNILIDKYGLCKVTDFGIARVSSNATITYTSSILGTVHYISPEQAKGKIVDLKSDLYSLGAVMYEMATGRVPFDADNSVGIAVMHIQDDPIPPREINPNLSRHLNYIIMKLLKKDPTERFQNASELIEALDDESLVKGEDSYEDTARIPIVVPKKETYPDPIEEEREAVYVSTGEEKSKKKKKRNPIKIWPLALLAFILVVAVYFFSSRMNKEDLEVPTVVNLTEEQAVNQLEKRGFRANISRYAESDEYEKGKVMSQDPEASIRAKKGTIVNLVISSGREIKVPELKNMNLSQAEETLKDLGLKVGTTSTDYSNTVDKDLVIRQEPVAGSAVQSGTEVNLVISVGKEDTTENIKVGNYIGMAEQDAIAAARKNHLRVRNVDYQHSSNVQKGLVMSQSIGAETEVAENSAIDFVISLGEEEKAKSPNREVEIRLNVASNKDNFNVKIYKVDSNGDRGDLLYNDYHTSSDLNSNGVLVLKFMAMSQTSVEVLVDDESYGVYQVN
ncbi:Stk1 family PASTA domain-containing Ser/Thr kinase [Anaerococcus lactolyticus]|uniref:non-specific serine/threonine protein kinase n=1 Tax=Anaerococcus lactolyticus S7-1-13 TaxID=1284686 RepID=A0A095X1C1_9FIRM|nr:Stk1 family PASTA domain-containing Ser/Thr kinase [Anaerococcus lactolyticus]KGF03536.1 serine/threonine protein kinase [Anaerococcus lactolyticus S7-1-13]